MEKLLLNPCDKECMRLAMLKHEEIFREQVYELHRLYQVQKFLMKNMTSSRHNPQQQSSKWNFKNKSNTSNLQLVNDHHLEDSNKILQGLDLERPCDQETIEMVDESELELTLGPSSFVRRSKLLSDAAAAPRNSSDSGPTSFSSSSTGSSHIKRTKSNGNRINNTAREEKSSSSQKWRVDHSTPISSSNPSRNFLGEIRKGSNVEDHLRQDSRLNNNNPPPWLFQVLSLNMTS